jgi:PA14 domain
MNTVMNKNTVTTCLLVVLVLVIAYRIMPVYVPANIKAIVSKNRVSITQIHQKRDIVSTRDVMLDNLNLYHKGKFGHAKLGNIAKASDDFFVDVDQMFTVHRPGNYQFLVGSDDGFSLMIDEKKICEHLKDRPYSIQSCNVFLNSGKHRFQISYFQGFGQSGFSVQYQTLDGKVHWFGENSPDLTLN